MLPGEEIIHVLPQDYVDGQGIKEPIGMFGFVLRQVFMLLVKLVQ